MTKTKKNLKGFTLVELIVVIAIIAILSTIGFVSYNGYIKDARNSVREKDTSQIVNLIAQFVANNGRTPRCESSAYICNFCLDATAGCTDGISTVDWAKMNVTKDPADPKKNTAAGDVNMYYVYGTEATLSDYQIAATKEADSYTAIVKGSKDASVAANALIDGTFVLAKKSDGLDPASWTVDCGNTEVVVDGQGSDTECIPYLW